MRIIIAGLLLLVACKMESKTSESSDECFPIIDKAVARLQKFGLVQDTVELDSALSLYDDAMHCDSLNDSRRANKATTLGRYRESLTILDNVVKVREVPTSRDAHFLMIKGWLYERLGEKDSSARYYERARKITRRQGA
jgi:tetratricopeptide (TPR) repeat protein